MGYECLLAGLPDLSAGSEAPITMEALQELLEEHLSPSHLSLLGLLQMESDDERFKQQMEEYDDTIIGQPDWWEEARENLSEVDLLTQLLYEEGMKAKNRFVRNWFAFNQDMCNIMVATICRKHGFDVRRAIVGHNPVAEILRKDLSAKDFGLGGIVDNINEMMALVEMDNLMEREKRMDALRFDWLEENTLFVHFSVENVLAYYLKAKMLNRWDLLTIEQGEKVFRALVADMKKGIKLD